MAKNGMEMLIAGAVIGAVVMLVALMSLGVSPGMTTAALSSTQNAQASASVNSYVDTSISGGTSITFGALDPGTSNNYATSAVTVITNTGNSNTAVDVYVQSTNLTNTTFVIPVGNLKVSKDNSTAWASLVNSPDWLASNVSADNGYYENVAKLGTADFYFKLDVPVAQEAADYTGTITIKSVKNGQAPN
ncbi:Uncharacterised protein [uncultured archaeon]|nr:Uncharacterised protein [uncultured archaeon]